MPYVRENPYVACIVSGSRNAQDAPKEELEWAELVERALVESECTLVIHGDAKGIDNISGYVARSIGIDVLPVPADWDKWDRAAGPIRNRAMLNVLSLLKTQLYHIVTLCFHDFIENGKGTLDMATQSAKAGVPTNVYRRKAPAYQFIFRKDSENGS